MASEQKSVLIKISEDFLSEIDAALPRLGYSDRSSFIRAAVHRELERQGVELPLEMIAAPSRKGKGGSPSHKENTKVEKEEPKELRRTGKRPVFSEESQEKEKEKDEKKGA